MQSRKTNTDPTTEAPALPTDQELIEKIIARAIRDYGEERVRPDRLRKAINAAHRIKPIRLNDLLNTCYSDFFRDVFAGAYRHYDEATDAFPNGWTAQHAEPKLYPWE